MGIFLGKTECHRHYSQTFISDKCVIRNVRIICAMLILLINDSVTAQTIRMDHCSKTYDSISKMDVFTYVDEMPEYPEDSPTMLEFIMKNIRYPEQDNWQSKFIIEFIIDINGKLINERIYDKVNDDELTAAEKEVLRVFRIMPNWKSGRCFGIPVPVFVKVPLTLCPE